MSRIVGVDGTNSQADLSLENQDSVDFQAIKERYEYEKQKRLRADAQSQYEELETSASSRLGSLAEDPFVNHEVLNTQPMRLVDGQEVKVIICTYVQEDVQVTRPLVDMLCMQSGQARAVDPMADSSHCSGRRLERNAFRCATC